MSPEAELYVHLGRRIRQRRQILQLTQRRLAGLCGVTFQQIQKYECAASGISAAKLWRLAQALSVPINYFFDGLERRINDSGSKSGSS